MSFEEDFPSLMKDGGYICKDGHERFNKGNIGFQCVDKHHVRTMIKTIETNIEKLPDKDLNKQIGKAQIHTLNALLEG